MIQMQNKKLEDQILERDDENDETNERTSSFRQPSNSKNINQKYK